MKQWYETIFENFGLQYDNEIFTQGTQGECDFIEQEAGYDKGVRILDIGCGTGRHSIELTKRGYRVTGIDLSGSLLDRAREKAKQQKVTVDFRQHDARTLPFDREFDLAIMICEGAFPLMETDEMNYRILQNAAKALKEHGKLIFTTLNGLFPLFHSVKDFMEKNSAKDDPRRVNEPQINPPVSLAQPDLTFDLMTFRDHTRLEMSDDDGNKKILDCNERYYVPSEITWQLKSLGFRTIGIYGAKLGAFSRNDKLTAEDFEMLVVAVK